MKLKIVILLVLFSALLVSASISTFSEFSASTSFSAAITVDKDKIKGNSSMQTSGVTEATAAQETSSDNVLQIGE